MMKTHTYSKKQTEEKPNPSVASISSSTYGMPPPTNSNTATRLALIDEMKYFFATATQHWEHNKPLKRFALPGSSGSGAPSGASSNGSGESISCVLWNDLFFITGTDIVRSLTFRFHAFGRPVTNAKKFEEGIFSDLRNLKPGHDARLEEPKSELLDMLYKNNCIRTQKKQKVFYWFSVPHDRLFLDALERDLKREKMGMEPTTQAVAEPAASLSLDSTQELFDQLRKSISQSAAATARAIEDDLSAANSALNTPVPNSSLSLNSIHQHHSAYLDTDPHWPTSPTPSSTGNHTPWSSSQSRLERAASQAKRSRVNSVPASIGQKQQLQLLQQQQKSHRLSHGSYFAGHPISTSSTASRRNNRRISSTSSSMLSSPTTATADDLLFRDDASSSTTTTAATVDRSLKASNSYRHHPQQHPDYIMDPISNGVNQLEITPSLSNTSHSTSTSSSMLQHNNNSSAVLPSKSLDSNAMKKTKTIFGNLSLFDGSPTYKQRRRRAASVSSSILNQPHPLHITAGGPERVVRRHDKCHLRTPSSATAGNQNSSPSSSASSHLSSNMVNSNSSRLAMAAVKAGFAPNQIISTPAAAPLPPPMPMMNANHSHGWRSSTTTTTAQQQDYHCPIPDCRHLFKRPEHLERHMQSLHMFICNVCGKHFPRSDHLAQHHRLEHEIQQYDHVSSLSGGGDNNNDDDSSSPDDYQRNFMFNTTYGTRQQNQHQQHQQQQMLSHSHQPQDTGFYSNSSRHSFDDARSTGWSTGISAGGSGSMSSSHNSSRCSTLSPMLDLDFDMPDIQPTNTAIPPTAAEVMNTPMSSSRSNTSLTTTESSSIILSDRQQQMYNASYYPEPSTSSFIKDEPNWSSNGMITTVATTTASAVQKSSSSLEDDLSSSSASSPSSTLQYTGDPFNSKVDVNFASSSSSNPNHLSMTLLSPFKPAQLQQQQHQQHQHQQHQQQQQQMQQQQMQEEHHLLQLTHLNEPYSSYAHHHQFDVNMNSMFPNNSPNPNPMNENSSANNYQSIYAPYVDQQYSPFITSPDNMNIVFGA
ncbi:hypothetical protein MAM1_0238d08540 [Mucor ambiguus]|uniref:C2H2-type domain-containing protein n=1 Tax=Mucor ambiguus TaxID=91626 RepID=A0A0C9N355_9FUNG|nr:hypothetical protein MAM1_0238d08540 [Mucor ambiguus]